jgi:hypothetical protein
MAAVPPPLVGARNATADMTQGFATLRVQPRDPPLPERLEVPTIKDPRDVVFVSCVPPFAVAVGVPVSISTLTTPM